MVIKQVDLQNFRSYESYHLELDPKLTVIVGKNGAGKTNLLEAIYVALHGSSFRTSDQELIRYGASWWRIQLYVDDHAREVRFQPDKKPPKHLILHETSKRFMYKDRLPLVLFEPTDLQLIHGSPARRRDELDTMLISLSYPYKQALSRYERAINQRNNILKKQPVNLEDALFSWDVLLSEYSVTIIDARRKLITRLNSLLSGYYSHISGSDHDVTIKYITSLPDQITSSIFMINLHKRLDLDRLRGTTSVGPHRDDIEFILGSVNAKQSASRGEIRTILLALKIAYAKLLETTSETQPLILLDDVFSELDSDRQQKLISLLDGRQTIITDTRPTKNLHYKEIRL